MANLFQIGYGGGPPKAIDYSKALDPLANKIGARLKESKAKTDALINNMPQGVPIDKVPEQLRGQVTDFLTQNKQAYVDASKVVASGIPSTDQRYIDAISTINQVDAKFKNLSNTLEDIALKRQAALDGRAHGKGSLKWQIGDHEDLANGTMYDNMMIQDDGGFNYKSNDNVTKRWVDYSNTSQTSNIGTDEFYKLGDNYKNVGKQGSPIDETRAREQFNAIITGLKPDGAKDYMFGDDSFLSTKIKAKFGTEEYNIELDKLVNSVNTDALLKEFESFKAKELVNANKIGLSQYDEMLALRNPASKGKTFSWGYRDNSQLTGIANTLKDLVSKESGEITLPNGVSVKWDGKNKVFKGKDEDGEYEINPQKIVNIFEGYYTQTDLFGGFDFTPSEIEENDNSLENQEINEQGDENSFLKSIARSPLTRKPRKKITTK
jgi:hypothetical protein